MIMHYYISASRKQKLKHHCLVGYDPASERAVYSLKIPKSKADLLRHFVEFEPDDPDGYDSYKVDYAKVAKLIDLLGHIARPPEELEYFIEPWVPQSHTRKV
jgi:hypothetical protein